MTALIPTVATAAVASLAPLAVFAPADSTQAQEMQ